MSGCVRNWRTLRGGWRTASPGIINSCSPKDENESLHEELVEDTERRLEDTLARNNKLLFSYRMRTSGYVRNWRTRRRGWRTPSP